MATKGVLTRPWCMLEILEARRRDVPIVLLVIQTKGFDAVQMREYIDHLEARLVVSNPSALQLLHKQVGDDLSELRAAMRSVLQEQEEGERLVWNPHAGDNEIIANLKDLVQSMAAATGRQGRLDWKEGPKKALSLRDVFGSKGDRSYAAYIACHHEEAVAEARVLQTALSKRCGRRVTIGTPAAALHMSRGDASAHLASDGVVLLLTKSTLHTPHCLTAIARAIYARKPIISILLTGRGYDFSAGQSLLRNLGEQLGAERLSELEEQLRVARLRSLANVARFSALGHFLPPAARLAGLGRQGGNSPSPARGTTAAVRFEEVTTRPPVSPCSPCLALVRPCPSYPLPRPSPRARAPFVPTPVRCKPSSSTQSPTSSRYTCAHLHHPVQPCPSFALCTHGQLRTIGPFLPACAVVSRGW